MLVSHVFLHTFSMIRTNNGKCFGTTVVQNDVPGSCSFWNEQRNTTIPFRIGGTIMVTCYVYEIMVEGTVFLL